MQNRVQQTLLNSERCINRHAPRQGGRVLNKVDLHQDSSQKIDVAAVELRTARAAATAASQAGSTDKTLQKKASVSPVGSSADSKKGTPQECQIIDGKFVDHRWANGRWDLSKFADSKGNPDWDKVIDAEMQRRRVLEDTPVDSVYKDPVNFDSAEIPWWAWVRRFHLPEAEKLNGRAAMVGYAMAWVVDALSGVGIVDQQHSFLGKLLLHIAVFGILIFRSADLVPKFKNLLDEATFYDKQWAATWEGQSRPSETEQ